MKQITEEQTTMYMLSKNKLFQLAKKYIDDNDIDGFNKYFMFMTPQLLDQLNQTIGSHLDTDELVRLVKQMKINEDDDFEADELVSGEASGWNQALDQVINLINQLKD